ncbi:hypothetical protein C4J85_3437 [Pseudomonas sp. R4-34-07]|nr:hypothetical protein C4J88_3407 [Pseudomonas sp. R4-39-08]AZF53915.1 hypothetical protein C4J85_3437 [Pseudomonas sp. R4-34-07]
MVFGCFILVNFNFYCFKSNSYISYKLNKNILAQSKNSG